MKKTPLVLLALIMAVIFAQTAIPVEVTGNNSIYTFMIQNCTADKTNVTCANIDITYECNVTPTSLIDTVDFYIEGAYYTTTQNGSFWSYTYNKAQDLTSTTDPISLTKEKIFDVAAGFVIDFQEVHVPRTCDVCTANYVINSTACNTSDQRYSQYVSDNETCAPSFNQTEACDYCLPDWEARTGGIYDCQTNDTQFVFYDDFAACYSATGLPSDGPPYNHNLTQSCSYLQGDFNCTIDPEPFLKGKIPIICELPTAGGSNNYQCQTYVKKDVNTSVLLQNNPEYVDKPEGSLISFGTQDTREYFSNTGQILNAHYTNKNLETGNTFIVGVKCSNNDTIITHEQAITPEYRGLNFVGNWLIYAKENLAWVVVGFILLIFLVGMAAYLIRQLNIKGVRQ